MRTFQALQTFECKETKSTYVQGLTYTVKPGNRLLGALAEVWVLQGKAVFLHDQNLAQLKGTGVVTDHPKEPSFWDQTKTAWRSLWP